MLTIISPITVIVKSSGVDLLLLNILKSQMLEEGH